MRCVRTCDRNSGSQQNPDLGIKGFNLSVAWTSIASHATHSLLIPFIIGHAPVLLQELQPIEKEKNLLWSSFFVSLEEERESSQKIRGSGKQEGYFPSSLYPTLADSTFLSLSSSSSSSSLRKPLPSFLHSFKMRREFSGIVTVFCVVLSLQTQSILSLVTASSARGGAATRTRLSSSTTVETTAQSSSIFDAGEMVVDDPAAVRISNKHTS